jgi:hypothetical protein
MTPRLLLHATCMTLALTGAARADYADDVVQQLTGQGYAEIRVDTTFLGRVRIVAMGDGGQREIILNPRTGEILRDLWVANGDSAPKVRIVDPSGSGSGSHSGTGSGSDDDDDDDTGGSGDDDDDDDGGDGDDNSGPGGGDDDDDDESGGGDEGDDSGDGDDDDDSGGGGDEGGDDDDGKDD